MKKLLFSIFATSLLVTGGMLSGCTSDMAGDIEKPEEIIDDNSGKEVSEEREFKERRSIELTEQTRAVAADLEGFYTNFTVDMARYADKHPEEVSDGNIVVSPLSMAMLMAMVANGVHEEDRQAFTDYLGTTDVENLNAVCRLLIEALPEADNLARLALANSVWVNTLTGTKLTEDFASVLRDRYAADIRYEDFSGKTTLEAINDWCSDKTCGLIPNFLKQSPEGAAMLLSAMYFQDVWKKEIFSGERIHDGLFHGKVGDSSVDMMESGIYTAPHSHNDDFEFFTVPFGNEAFQLEIILPVEGHQDIELTEDIINVLANDATRTDMVVTLPKFRVDGHYNVSSMLAATGRPQLTEVCMDIMEECPLQGGILYEHATSFSVDEKGAEAVAISSGNLVGFGSNDDDYAPLQIKVDRPFWFFIREFSTGACILSGRIVNL
ncbi:MAG: serpin family protein [Bacteroides sp.]|nr:serpin family protein [Bacteroides sp.]MBD5358737.1 serpin family protein [Bacteroides sp.]